MGGFLTNQRKNGIHLLFVRNFVAIDECGGNMQGQLSGALTEASADLIDYVAETHGRVMIHARE